MATTANGDARVTPTFWLYEEATAHDETEADFVHIETVSSRAGLHNWEIRPHRHVHLCQFLLIRRGGGRLLAEGREATFRAPAVISVPSSLVHGFCFDADSEGHVLTVSNRFLDQATGRGAGPIVGPSALIASEVELDHEWTMLNAAFEVLAGELPWRRPGRERAAAACLELILTALGRRAGREDERRRGNAGTMALAHRFRVLVQAHATDGWTAPQYARALGVSVERLNRACRIALDRSPIQLVHDRIIAEAKSSLIYTGLTVQEIGVALGFSDPAYFTRFFSLRAGCSPTEFRSKVLADRR